MFFYHAPRLLPSQCWSPVTLGFDEALDKNSPKVFGVRVLVHLRTYHDATTGADRLCRHKASARYTRDCALDASFGMTPKAPPTTTDSFCNQISQAVSWFLSGGDGSPSGVGYGRPPAGCIRCGAGRIVVQISRIVAVLYGMPHYARNKRAQFQILFRPRPECRWECRVFRRPVRPFFRGAIQALWTSQFSFGEML